MGFLALDIGNTRLKWALYPRAQPATVPVAHGAVFLETIDDLAEGEWKRPGVADADARLRRRRRGGAPARRAAARAVGPVAALGGARRARRRGSATATTTRSRLGADRWVALIGARWHVLARGAPRPVLVVMVGTAVTVDALDTEGRFLGGLILPGFGLMLKALEMGTAGLKVPTGEVVEFPTNTSDALMSGGAYAIAGAVRRQYRRCRRAAVWSRCC